MRVADLVEKPLEDDLVLRRQRAQRRLSPSPGSRRVAPQPRPTGRARTRPTSLVASRPSPSLPVICSRRRETANDNSSVRPGASPNQNGIFGGCPFASSTIHLARVDLQNAVRHVAELKDIAGQALEGKVFVQRADRYLLRQHHDVVVELVGDRPAVRQSPSGVPRGGHARAPLTTS